MQDGLVTNTANFVSDGQGRLAIIVTLEVSARLPEGTQGSRERTFAGTWHTLPDLLTLESHAHASGDSAC